MKYLVCLMVFTSFMSVNILAQTSYDSVSRTSKNGNDVNKNINRLLKNEPIIWYSMEPGDTLWQKRLWRQIDLFEKNNAPFRNDPAMPKINVFANILMSGLKEGSFKAYSDGDTAFAHPLSIHDIDTLTLCDAASLSKKTRILINRYNKNSNDSLKSDTSLVTTCIYPEQIEFYYLKEIWLFDKKNSQMVVHIFAIAPVANVNGVLKPLFWLHYPDIRNYLAQYEVFRGEKSTTYTWDEYFESRQFSSKITWVDPAQNGGIKPKQKHRRRKEKRETKEGKVIETWVY
jgi:gliding motility associated protien GldN